MLPPTDADLSKGRKRTARIRNRKENPPKRTATPNRPIPKSLPGQLPPRGSLKANKNPPQRDGKSKKNLPKREVFLSYNEIRSS